MKRLQSFGRSRYFSLGNSSRSSSESSEKLSTAEKYFKPTTTEAMREISSIENIMLNENREIIDTPILTLLSLPDKVLCKILNEMDISTLLTLCHLNSKLYSLISNHFLFNHPRMNIKLHSKMSLLKFNALIHAEHKTANIHCGKRNVSSKNARFLVTTIEFVDPQCQDSLLKYSKFYNRQGSTSIIGGSYNLNSIATSPNSINGGHSKIINNRNIDRKLHVLDKWEAKYSHYTYIELMLDIIDYLPNLIHLKLTHIDKTFKIPLWYSVFNDGSRDFMKKIIKGQQSMTMDDLRTFQISDNFAKEYEHKLYGLPRIKRLELHGSLNNGKDITVPLRSNLLCCFGIVNELILVNLVIDTVSLDTPMEFLPLNLRRETKIVSDDVDTSTINRLSNKISDNKDYNNKKSRQRQQIASPSFTVHATYNSLTLQACNIIPGNGILRLFQAYFKDVKRFSLLSLVSTFDLLIANCFPNLKDLTIDCDSKCFNNERYVSDSYYYKQTNASLDTYNGTTDFSSMTDTLLDDPDGTTLQSPPPTSFAIMSWNLNYINRTITDIQSSKRKPLILTTEQGNFFRATKIPEFHCFFHYYKNLWDKLPQKSININIINIPFTNVFPLSPKNFMYAMLQNNESFFDISNNNNNSLEMDRFFNNPEADQETLIAFRNNNEAPDYYWNDNIRQCIRDTLQGTGSLSVEQIEDVVKQTEPDIFNNYQNFKLFKDIPNLNLYYFLKSLSNFKSVKIQMLRSFIDCTARTRYDWELLLGPVMNVNVPVKVTDRDGIKLYSYGFK